MSLAAAHKMLADHYPHIVLDRIAPLPCKPLKFYVHIASLTEIYSRRIGGG
jgi:hypothetical protein